MVASAESRAKRAGQGNSERIPEITVTATRRATHRADVMRATTVVPNARSGLSGSLPEMLQGASGVFVQRTTSGQGAPILRGFIGSSVLILVDGMRLNNAIFRPSPNQYLALVDPFYVDRIEVVRGTGSSLYGSDAMGGVVNVLTRLHTFGSDEWEARAGVTTGLSTADLGFAGHSWVAAGKQGVSLAGHFSYRESDDIRTGSGRVKPTGYTSWTAGGRISVEGEGQDFLLSADYLRQPSTPRIDELVVGYGQNSPSSAVFVFEPNDRLFLHSRYRKTLPAGYKLQRFEGHLAYQGISDDRRTRDFGTTEEIRSFNRSQYVGVTAQLAAEYSDAVRFDFGTDAYFDWVNSSATARDVETDVVTQTRSRFAENSQMTTIGIYVQSDVSVTESLSATLSSRISYFGLEIPTADRGVGVRRDIFDVTGQISLLYRLLPELSLVTNLGRGVRAPNVFDFSTFGPRPGNRFNIPNSDLDVEQILGCDLGMKAFYGSLSGSLFFFYSDLTDNITAVGTGEQTEDGRDIVQSRNVTSATFAGVEADLRWQIHPQAEIRGNVTYTWAEQGMEGGFEPADRIPPVNGLVGVTLYPHELVSIGTTVRWAGDQNRLSARDRQDPRIDPSGTPGWATLNLHSNIAISPQWEMDVSLANVFDSSYRAHGSGIDAPGIGFSAALKAEF